MYLLLLTVERNQIRWQVLHGALLWSALLYAELHLSILLYLNINRSY